MGEEKSQELLKDGKGATGLGSPKPSQDTVTSC